VPPHLDDAMYTFQFYILFAHNKRKREWKPAFPFLCPDIHTLSHVCPLTTISPSQLLCLNPQL